MLLPILLALTVHAAPKVDTYYLDNDHYLTVKRAEEKQVDFELEGINSFSGNTSEFAGMAERKDSLWEYQDKDEKSCRIQLRAVDSKSVQVSLIECHGRWCEDGVYRLREKNCGSGFDKRSKEVGALSRKKKFAEALKKADALAKDCLADLDENGKGELHSDLAFLAFQTGNKKRCRDEVKAGIEALGATRGLKGLEEDFDYYAEEDGGGKKSCKEATRPGCGIYEERIKVFKRLSHNGGLCR